MKKLPYFQVGTLFHGLIPAYYKDNSLIDEKELPFVQSKNIVWNIGLYIFAFVRKFKLPCLFAEERVNKSCVNSHM